MHFYIVELCFILKYILKCGYMYIILMCISCFMFFANDLLLFIFILDQGNDVRPKKKKIQAIFVSKFKMGRKAVETTCNVSNAFGPGTANECIVQWWFKKFCKGDESLEDEHNG